MIRYSLTFLTVLLAYNAASITDINLAVVACGDRVNETLVLLKSAILFTKSKLNFYIFTEPNLHHEFINQLESWQSTSKKKRFTFNIQNVQFPNENNEEWRRLFRLCASQRIFLPELLPNVDSLLYVDTDVLFLSSLNDIWSHFKQFNSTQLAALAPEHEEEWMGWYNRFARHPYYGKLGLNSGVMLMNLTRMRQFKLSQKIGQIYETYKYNITWGDQCLLNILFHFYPETLLVYDCKWNYRPDHCMYGCNCKTAANEGARILHGCRRVFHNDKEPAFAAIYNAFKDFELNKYSRKKLLKRIVKELDDPKVMQTYCGKLKENLLQHVRRLINSQLSKSTNKMMKKKYKNEEL